MLNCYILFIVKERKNDMHIILNHSSMVPIYEQLMEQIKSDIINSSLKEGDLILVSAEATGLGKPMEAIIDKIETFMGQTLVTVTYTQPNALSGFGGCFVDSHITLSEEKAK